MLSEEVLILCAVFVGLGLLALGILEHLSSAPPRLPERPSDDDGPPIKR